MATATRQQSDNRDNLSADPNNHGNAEWTAIMSRLMAVQEQMQL